MSHTGKGTLWVKSLLRVQYFVAPLVVTKEKMADKVAVVLVLVLAVVPVKVPACSPFPLVLRLGMVDMDEVAPFLYYRSGSYS
jgi:hypothetical protein